MKAKSLPRWTSPRRLRLLRSLMSLRRLGKPVLTNFHLLTVIHDRRHGIISTVALYSSCGGVAGFCHSKRQFERVKTAGWRLAWLAAQKTRRSFEAFAASNVLHTWLAGVPGNCKCLKWRCWFHFQLFDSTQPRFPPSLIASPQPSPVYFSCPRVTPPSCTATSQLRFHLRDITRCRFDFFLRGSFQLLAVSFPAAYSQSLLRSYHYRSGDETIQEAGTI